MIAAWCYNKPVENSNSCIFYPAPFQKPAACRVNKSRTDSVLDQRSAEKRCWIYLVRHGTTDWNEKGIIQGQLDIPLAKIGEEQAKIVAQELKNVHFDAVFSSDLMRTKRTAEIITLEKNLAIQTTKLLRERHYGEFQGKVYAARQAYNVFVAALNDEERFSHKSHGVESDEEIVTRLITFLRETAIIHKNKSSTEPVLDKTVLVSTHGDIIHKFLIHLGFGTYKNFPLSSIVNTAYVKLACDGVDFFVQETVRIKKPNPNL